MDLVDGIVGRLGSATQGELQPIVETTRDLVLAGLTHLQTADEAAPSLPDAALMERARRYVLDNLATVELSPDGMARALGISRTKLYGLLEASGGVLKYIQTRRLMAAHLALGDPMDTRRIFEIAEACGFSNAAHFSRAFTKEFGYGPRQARNTPAAPRPAVARSTGASQSPSFRDLLRSLGT